MRVWRLIPPGRGRRPTRPPATIEGGFDPNEVIHQDPTSGRKWCFAEVHFLSAAEKRRLEVERPLVWKGYRTRFLRDLTVPPTNGEASRTPGERTASRETRTQGHH